jgi:hypothetical protein
MPAQSPMGTGLHTVPNKHGHLDIQPGRGIWINDDGIFPRRVELVLNNGIVVFCTRPIKATLYSIPGSPKIRVYFPACRDSTQREDFLG